MKKDELRQFIRMQKRQFSAPQMAELSKPIIRQLLAHPRVKNAGTILMYCALDDEVQTQEALDRLVALGKTVLLPAVINSQDMELRRYSGPQDLITGFFNISEPTGELFTQYADIDVAVVPGMAFHRHTKSALASIASSCPASPLMPTTWLWTKSFMNEE